MNALERYLLDCENKRRRSRDRPSNEVLSDLRRLLTQVKGSVEATPPAEAESEDLQWAGLHPQAQL
jgi:hypothetical protein